MHEPVFITHSLDSDSDAIRRLALLDDRRPPHGPALLAWVDGELRAAVGILDGQVVADPFHRTADLVELLRLEARFEEAA
jgi:hypothetical protein